MNPQFQLTMDNLDPVTGEPTAFVTYFPFTVFDPALGRDRTFGVTVYIDSTCLWLDEPPLPRFVEGQDAQPDVILSILDDHAFGLLMLKKDVEAGGRSLGKAVWGDCNKLLTPHFWRSVNPRLTRPIRPREK